MKKRTYALLAALVAAVAAPVLATTTFTEPTTLPSYVRVSKAATTTGTEGAPTSANAGLDLSGLKGFSVMVETANGSNMTAGGTFQAYLLNPVTGRWLRVSDGSLDFVSYATSLQSVSGFTVAMPYGAIAYEPNGVGTAVNIYQLGR